MNMKNKGGRPSKPHVIVQMRLDVDVVKRIELYRARQVDIGESIPTTTRAVEMLLTQALDAAHVPQRRGEPI